MKIKPAPVGILRRCENPTCHELIDNGRFCSHKCHTEWRRAQMVRPIRECALPSCSNTFEVHPKRLDQKYCCPACATAARVVHHSPKAVFHREKERDRKRKELDLVGPAEPMIKPWVRKERPILMTDAEQIEINVREHIRDFARMEQPLTAAVARRYGAAV